MLENFKVGDQVKVYFKSLDTARAKTQVFSGIVIRIRGTGLAKTFTVLKDAKGGIKVERIFPLNSPLLEKVEVVKKAEKVRRAKLYYLRDRAKSWL